MKALVFHNGAVALQRDLPQPQRGSGEVLIRVTCAGICATDLELIKGYMGFSGIPGHEFAGIVVESDRDRVTGRRVAGEINIACGECDYCQSGLGRHCPSRSVLGILNRNGAFAEYVTLPEKNLHFLPENVSDEEAVFIEPLAAAFEIPQQLKIGPEQSVCLLGDGRLGLLTAQVLALFTANLTVVGRHRHKLAILEGLGIKTAPPDDVSGRFDIVVDCTGSENGADQAMSLVKPRGTIVLKTTAAVSRHLDLNQLVIDEITVIGSRCGPFQPAIDALAEKKIQVEPLIDGVFPLEEGPQALRHAAQKGVLKVLLRM